MEESKKNVLYIGGFELPDRNAAAQRVVSNAKLFSKLNYNVSLIGINKNNNSQTSFGQQIKIDDYYFKCWYQHYPKSHFEWLYFLTDITFIKNIIKKNIRIK